MRLPCLRFARVLFATSLALSLALRLAAAAPSPTGETLLEQAYALDAAKGNQRDAAGAARLYAAAAESGDAFAHLRLGHLCEVGDGVPQDYAAARAHYQAAADLGLAAARVPLAVCNLEGWGGPVDREAFAREIRLAAEAGEASAQRIFGTMHAIGFVVAKDAAAGVVWLERAAKTDVVAQHQLGQMAEQAQRFVTAHNTEIARNWYQLSAEQEYVVGMRAMARTFIDTTCGTPDWDACQRWLTLADEAGDAEAPYILALVEMLPGRLPNPDEKRARAWLESASQRGNFRATEVLDFVSAGQSIHQAIGYVMTESQEERYVQRVRQKAGNGPTRQPVPIKTVMPIYPLTFRMTGVTGTVTLEFVVDTAGRVRRITTIATAHPLFTERAIAALQQWRFEPARKNGRNVNCRVQLDFPFLLSDETANGTDGLLAEARSQAQERGPEFQALATDLRLAHPTTHLAVPTHAFGPRNERRGAFVLLAIDAMGKPERGLVLHAEPAELGTELLAIGLAAHFEPRRIGGEAVPSNVLLPCFSDGVTPLLPVPGH